MPLPIRESAQAEGRHDRSSTLISEPIFWPRFRRNRLAVAGAVIVLLLLVVSVLAPVVVPFGPNEINAWEVLSPPSGKHWFGTDDLGRDVLSRVIFGARISLKVGFVAVGIAVSIGTVLGLLAGYYGGWVDTILMRVVDIMLCFPDLLPDSGGDHLSASVNLVHHDHYRPDRLDGGGATGTGRNAHYP